MLIFRFIAGLAMKWYTLFVWLTCIGLESVLFVRVFLWRAFRTYPLFFCYLVLVLTQDVFFLGVYLFRLAYYAPLYWYGEFLSVAVGCAVCWEVFRLVLGPFQGTGRMARILLLLAMGSVVAKAVAVAWLGSSSWPTTAVALERNLRETQALCLTVLAALSAYYRIPMSRNVKGVFMGYGLFIATNLVTLTLRVSIGPSFGKAWILFQPLCYLAVLAIWCKSLWRYEPAGSLDPAFGLEHDYQALVLATRKSLLQARTLLDRSSHL